MFNFDYLIPQSYQKGRIEVLSGLWVSYLTYELGFKSISENWSDGFWRYCHNDFLDEYGLWFLVSIDTTKDGGMKMEIEAKGRDWQLIDRIDFFESDFQRVELPKRFLKTLCLYADIPEQKSLEDVFSYLSYKNVTSIDVMEAWQPSLLADGFENYENCFDIQVPELNVNVTLIFQKNCLVFFFYHLLPELTIKKFIFPYRDYDLLNTVYLPQAVRDYFESYIDFNLIFSTDQ